uniref:RNA-directed DNA polymerase n=1 Tax=Tanacetum cinerariifolium TaxID=118510 RepID=A0A6L2JCX9_TANCI|nr:DNA-directed DNA polymerase [Tanacetum cinerariifolium]
MSTRSYSSNLFSPLRDPDSLIRQRNLGEPSSLFDFEEVMNNNHNQEPPPAGPPPQNNNGPPPMPPVHSRDRLCYYGPPGFNQPNVQNRYNQNQNQRNFQASNHQAPNNYGRGQNFNQGNNNFQAPNFQAQNFQAQVGPSNELTNYMKSNEAILREMRIQMTNMKTKLRNEFKSTIDAITNKIETQNNQIINILTNMQMQNSSGSGPLPSNTIANPRGDLKAITTRSGVSYDGPPIPPPFSSHPKVVERVPEVTKDTVKLSTENIQPSVVQTQVQIDEPVVAPKPKPSIPYLSRANKQKLHEKDDNLALKFVEIFRNLHFNLTTTPVNENCLAVILKKLPVKLRDPGKFLISCDFLELVECLALADLGASINLMPLSIWKKLSLPELTPTRMILELADRSTTRPAGIAEDVFVKVGKFHFPIDYVVVDYVVDPRVPLILGRPFLRTGRALIDVYGEELTLRVDDEAITFKVACEEYVQEVFRISKIPKSGNPTPTSDPIISSSSPSFAPFEGSDFILEEIETFLQTPDEPSNLDDDYYDMKGGILYLEKLLNEDPSPNLPPVNTEDLKQVDATMTKPSIEEPPELELKELPFICAFLKGTDKLPVIIPKELKDEEKSALLKVLKSHKRAIAWKISDIKGIDPRFFIHKILIEDDFKPMVQHQRRVNSKIHEVIKKEVIKLLDAGLIYPIFDSPWVSLVHCVPKKGGITVVENEDNELIPTRFRLTHKTKKRLSSLALMERLPTDVCLLVYAMLQARSKVFGDSFSSCLSHLDKMLKRCENTNLVLNWEKCHFMVKEGIILSQKISKFGIEVDIAKVDVIAKLPNPTSVKGVVLGQRKTKHFQPIHYASKTMTDAQAHYTTTKKELLAVVYAFEKLRPYPVLSKTIVYTDHSALKYLLTKQDAKPRLLRWILLLQEFDVIIHDKKGAENLAADHLSRLENPH